MEAQIRLARRASELWTQVQAARDPAILAARTGTTFVPLEIPDQEGPSTPAAVPGQAGAFEFLLWQRPVRLLFPACKPVDANTGEPLDTFHDTLLAYYFVTSNGAPLTGEWIAFTDLPDGRFYTQAFQGYSGNELARCFGNDLDRFSQAAQRLGGKTLSLGDQAFTFKALPLVDVAAVAWAGDDDFSPSYKILFDAACPHHLTTDALALVGSALARKLMKLAEEPR